MLLLMNIFATSPDPTACAQALDDKRVVKMVLESAQVICTVLNSRGIPTPYRSTHEHNPITLWSHDDDHLAWLTARSSDIASARHIDLQR